MCGYLQLSMVFFGLKRPFLAFNSRFTSLITMLWPFFCLLRQNIDLIELIFFFSRPKIQIHLVLLTSTPCFTLNYIFQFLRKNCEMYYEFMISSFFWHHLRPTIFFDINVLFVFFQLRLSGKMAVKFHLVITTKSATIFLSKIWNNPCWFQCQKTRTSVEVILKRSRSFLNWLRWQALLINSDKTTKWWM